MLKALPAEPAMPSILCMNTIRHYFMVVAVWTIRLYWTTPHDKYRH